MPEGSVRGLGWAGLEPPRVRLSVGLLVAVVLAHAAAGAAVAQRLGSAEPPRPLVVAARLIEAPSSEPVGESQAAAPAPVAPSEPTPSPEPPPAPQLVAEPPKANPATRVPERPKPRLKPKPKPIRPKSPKPSVPPPEVARRETPAPKAAPPASVAAGAPAPAARPGTSVRPASAASSGPTTGPSYRAAYLSNPAPAYPEEARRRSEEGRVLLRVQVSAAGAPSSVQLARSSGSALLDRAAVAAVSRWRFVPARRGGQPVVAAVLVPLSFSLRR